MKLVAARDETLEESRRSTDQSLAVIAGTLAITVVAALALLHQGDQNLSDKRNQAVQEVHDALAGHRQVNILLGGAALVALGNDRYLRITNPILPTVVRLLNIPAAVCIVKILMMLFPMYHRLTAILAIPPTLRIRKTVKISQHLKLLPKHSGKQFKTLRPVLRELIQIILSCQTVPTLPKAL